MIKPQSLDSLQQAWLFEWESDFAESRSHTEPAHAEQEQLAIAEQHLWLCGYFPCIMLDVLEIPDKEPAVVIEGHAARPQVLACNAAAQAQGIEEGMPLSAALALQQSILVRRRQPALEQKALRQLADAVWRYSDCVVLFDDRSLMIDIKGSLRLFKGLDNLLADLEQQMRGHAVQGRWVSAPSMQGAYCLASMPTTNATLCYTDQAQLSVALRPLPIRVLAAASLCRRLSRSGINTLGQLLSLPRRDAVRRFGKTLFTQLDQAFCRQAETICRYSPTSVFTAEHDFYLPTDNKAWLCEAVAPLLMSMEHFLRKQYAATRCIKVAFYHERESASRMVLGAAKPLAAAEHWQHLFASRVESMALAAPVSSLVLSVQDTQAFDECANDLFDQSQADQHSWSVLIDQLTARDASLRVSSLLYCEDRRPERVHRLCALSEMSSEALRKAQQKTNIKVAVGQQMARPLALLHKPQRLHANEQSVYWLGSRLRLLSPRERIEQGWWDNNDVRRDYYIAETAQHYRLWVYQNLRTSRWFLHGFFS